MSALISRLREPKNESVAYIIAAHDWRTVYLTLAAPVLIVVLPLLLILVRTRPPGEVPQTVAETTRALRGLELGEAIGTLAFWMLIAKRVGGPKQSQMANGLY